MTPVPHDIVKLSLRGQIVITTRDSFYRFPNSLLARFFSGKSVPIKSLPDGSYFFNRDPSLFTKYIMPLYDYGFWSKREPITLCMELQYWGLTQDPPRPGTMMSSKEEVFCHRILEGLRRMDEDGEVIMNSLSEYFSDNCNKHGWLKDFHASHILKHYETQIRCFAMVYYGLQVEVYWPSPTKLTVSDGIVRAGGVAGYIRDSLWTSHVMVEDLSHCLIRVLDVPDHSKVSQSATLDSGISVYIKHECNEYYLCVSVPNKYTVMLPVCQTIAICVCNDNEVCGLLEEYNNSKTVADRKKLIDSRKFELSRAAIAHVVEGEFLLQPGLLRQFGDDRNPCLEGKKVVLFVSKVNNSTTILDPFPGLLEPDCCNGIEEEPQKLHQLCILKWTRFQ